MFSEGEGSVTLIEQDAVVHDSSHKPFVEFSKDARGEKLRKEYERWEQASLEALAEMEIASVNEEGLFVCDLERIANFQTGLFEQFLVFLWTGEGIFCV